MNCPKCGNDIVWNGDDTIDELVSHSYSCVECNIEIVIYTIVDK
jgi:predicted RNA-binding Zn-ribbon protein involved in translation (DUF1610 family)